MELHHGKHHQAYVNNLKAALEKMDEAVEAGDDAAVHDIHTKACTKAATLLSPFPPTPDSALLLRSQS